MTLNAGHVVWLSCEVKPGPFSDERKVRLCSSFGDWIGFVPASFLQEPILEGETKIPVLIIDVESDRFSAKIPGEGIGRTLYGDLISKAKFFDPIPT